ncbi:hypothetical protein HHI36_016574 [Cryptolaemus montrouzieri]|uniref:Uncharacterized protein n=1 Tax=Cryptolaemus montrouzieri TaxID=559131 RepID=A0ABD2NKJ7_9CUCU
MVGRKVFDDQKLKRLSRYFNGSTIRGRAHSREAHIIRLKKEKGVLLMEFEEIERKLNVKIRQQEEIIKKLKKQILNQPMLKDAEAQSRYSTNGESTQTSGMGLISDSTLKNNVVSEHVKKIKNTVDSILMRKGLWDGLDSRKREKRIKKGADKEAGSKDSVRGRHSS